MKLPTHPSDWDRARYYLAWAKRVHRTPEKILTFPKHPSLKLNLLDKVKVEVLLERENVK